MTRFGAAAAAVVLVLAGGAGHVPSLAAQAGASASAAGGTIRIGVLRNGSYDIVTLPMDVYVGRVRRKVDGQQAYPLIHTVRGVGFCIRAPY